MRTTSVALLFFVHVMIGCTGATSPSPINPVESPSPAEPGSPSAAENLVDLEGLVASCHAIGNTAPLVAEEDVVGTRPPFTGGTIQPGLYHRVRTIRYVSTAGEPKPDPTREKQTLRISANGSAEVVHANEGGADDPTSFV